jgi:adenylosuccinate lyase
LLADELLSRATRVLQGLVVREEVIARNLRTYGVFAATERLLMEAVKAGGNRQELHEVIRVHSLAAWEALRRGDPNPLPVLLRTEPRIIEWLLPGEVASLLDASDFTGDAPSRARALARSIRQALMV